MPSVLSSVLNNKGLYKNEGGGYGLSMNTQITPVKGGYHAVGPGAGREIVTFGRTRLEAEERLALARERSLRLQRLVEERRVSPGLSGEEV